MEYTVVSDLFMISTAQFADLALPAAHWLEQDDLVHMHKIRCVLTRKKLAQVGETRDDQHVILDVVHRLGLWEAFPWPDRTAYLDWLSEGMGMRTEEFRDRDIVLGEMRYKKYESEGFPTPSGKFELCSNVMEHADRTPCRFMWSRPCPRHPPLSSPGNTPPF